MMKAMVLQGSTGKLRQQSMPVPTPMPHQALLKVSTCGVCRTDLHIADGDLPQVKNMLIPGHEVVGHVAAMGDAVSTLKIGQRVGVPWLAHTCGTCKYCQTAHENLCDEAQFTGYHLNGGFAEYMLADELACYPLPHNYTDVEVAPLLCAGLIGYRSLQMATPCRRLGLYGFGAAAHIICQIARYQGIEVYAFTRPGDLEAQQLAASLGASWVGDSLQNSPCELDAAIIFAAVGALVPQALKQLSKGGKLVCAGIHMSDIPAFPYADLWGERSICSVANLTRQDGLDFFQLAANTTIKTTTTLYELTEANQALESMRAGTLTGAAVLKVSR